MSADPFTGYLQELCSYNTWANERCCQFIEGAGEERCLLKQESSFGTIRETLIHVWDAQHIWLERLQGRSPAAWPGQNFTGTALQAARELCLQSAQWESFASGFDAERILLPVNYTNLRGDVFSSTVAQITAHVMNHGTFHRGQLVTMLRGSGYNDLKQTDLIAFYRHLGTPS